MDGEACFGVNKYYRNEKWYHYPSIQVNMVNKPTIHRLHEIFGVGSISRRLSASKGGRPYYGWNVSGKREVLQVVEAVYPYLFTKRDEAKVVLDLLARVQKQGRGGFRISPEEEAARELLFIEARRLKKLFWED